MDNIGVELELLKHSDFSDGRTRDTVVTVVNFDLLDGINLPLFSDVACLVNYSVGTLAELRQVLVGCCHFIWSLGWLS